MKREERFVHETTEPGPPPSNATIETTCVEGDPHVRRAGDPDFMLSLARGLQVTSALARRKRPSTVSQLSLETGLSRSVVRRCLYTLTAVGVADRDDRRHFFLRSDIQWRIDAPRPR